MKLCCNTGGAFYVGSSTDYGASYLMQQDIGYQSRYSVYFK